MKKILFVVTLVAALQTAAFAGDDKSCGAHMAEKAVLSAKMSEMMTNVAAMMDVHAAAMLADKSKPSKQEATALKKLAAQHRKLAAEFKKTEKMMADMASLPPAPHDQAKMMADPAITKAFDDMLRSHKEFESMLKTEVAQMEAMKSGMKK